MIQRIFAAQSSDDGGELLRFPVGGLRTAFRTHHKRHPLEVAGGAVLHS